LSHASKGRCELYMLASYFVKEFYVKIELFNLTGNLTFERFLMAN